MRGHKFCTRMRASFVPVFSAELPCLQGIVRVKECFYTVKTVTLVTSKAGSLTGL